jgi:hypothetical protein
LPDGYSPDHKGTPMKLILDTLEAARRAASPSDAIILADAIADLADLAEVLAAVGMTLEDVLPALGERQALREHVRAQPFEVIEGPGRDGETLQIVDDLTPGAFAEWLATLESLAQ